MANKFKLTNKQALRLAMSNVHLYYEKVDLEAQLKDMDDAYARLLTANEQLRAGMDAIIELARGNACRR